MAVAESIFGVLAMSEDPTTVIIQRYLDASPGDTAAEAATVVGVSQKTVQRRLNEARLLLAERLADLRPPPPPVDTPPT
jgi:DNA-directed RNA polymerase specialized sigma24 family protein